MTYSPNRSNRNYLIVKQNVSDQIDSFSIDQSVYFAGLCAIRSLPFLCVSRNFSVFKDNDKQKYLYSIFNAIDSNLKNRKKQVVYSAHDDALAAAATTSVYEAFNAANTIAKTADKDAIDARNKVNTSEDITAAMRIANAKAVIAKNAHIAANVIYTVYSAADAAATATVDVRDATEDMHKVYTNAARAAAAEAAAYAITRCDTRNVLYDVIFSDINCIKTDKLDLLNNNVAIYGEIWRNFQADLKTIRCGYWAKLYEDLFTNRFVVDQGLERRLYVADEFKAQGAAVVADYLIRAGDNVEQLDEARIIILGDKGAGKTSLARKLLDINAEMPREDESTEGVSVLRWKLQKDQKDGNMNVHIWDFAGHTITHAAHRCFMSSRCLYIYVYNGRVEQGNDPEYWLEQIKMHGGNSPILFLINEKDDHKSDIAKKTLKEEYPSIIQYYNVDIGNKDTRKLENFRKIVIDFVRKNPSWNRQEISANAYRVKEKLYTYFEENKANSISRDKFNEIAKEQNVPQEKWQSVLKDLRVLGICLWYEDKEMDLDTFVLNPEWITTGIYKIINWGFNNSKFKFSLDDGKEIFIDEHNKRLYPQDKIQFLFKLMKIYDLAYFIDDDPTKIFVPLLLPSDRPDGLPVFPYGERLTMHVFVEKVLPPNIVSRLIVQRNDDIKEEEKQLWRKGAVLHYQKGDTVALIKEETQCYISVQVKGKDNTAYIVSIRETLEKIFEKYKTVKPDFHYEVIDNWSLEKSPISRMTSNIQSNEQPWMVTEEDLKGHSRRERSLFNSKRDVETSPEPTLKAYGLKIKTGDNSNVAVSLNVNSPQAKNQSKTIINPPSEISSETFLALLDKLTEFLQTKDAEKELRGKDKDALQAAIVEAKKESNLEKAWNILRQATSTIADIATILTATGIPQTIANALT